MEISRGGFYLGYLLPLTDTDGEGKPCQTHKGQECRHENGWQVRTGEMVAGKREI